MHHISKWVGTVLATSAEDGLLSLYRKDFSGNWTDVQTLPSGSDPMKAFYKNPWKHGKMVFDSSMHLIIPHPIDFCHVLFLEIRSLNQLDVQRDISESFMEAD